MATDRETDGNDVQAFDETTPITVPVYDDEHATDGLPAWTYLSDGLVQLEYERVILPSWQFACHVSQVREPGQFVTLDMMRDSIAVVCGRDGRIRAFKNVCRHRGARLLEGNGKCRGSIVCPYHGWTYGLDGGLKALPAKRTFPGLDLGDHSLVEVESEVFFGLVFVRVISEGGGAGVRESWGEFAKLLEGRGIERLELDDAGIQTEVWNCNWKTAVDNNLENYHLPIGHPGYERLLDYDAEGQMNEHGVAISDAVHRDELSPAWTERLYQRFAPEVLSDLPAEARTSWLFATMPPNTGVDIYPDSMDVFQILPRTATTCFVRYPIFRPRDTRREARLLRYLNYRINRQAANEDKELCERVQKGLGSHGYQPGPLSALEVAIKDFHDRIRAAIPETRLPDPPPHLAPGARAVFSADETGAGAAAGGLAVGR
ncbi:MAG: aromatic ring-hydroxylating dioxygenase subunit alpha [Hyphomicrobiaceae bacterium]